MEKYILLIGDEIVKNGQKKEDLLTQYNEQIKIYKKSGGRPSLEPTIWKLIKAHQK